MKLWPRCKQGPLSPGPGLTLGVQETLIDGGEVKRAGGPVLSVLLPCCAPIYMPIIYASQRFTLGQRRRHTICLLSNGTEHYLRSSDRLARARAGKRLEERSKAPQYDRSSVHLCLNETCLSHTMTVRFSVAPAQAPMKLWLHLCSLTCSVAPGAHYTSLVSPPICWVRVIEQKPPWCC